MSETEKAALDKLSTELPYRVQISCNEFLKRYPSDPRRWNAKLLLLDFHTLRVVSREDRINTWRQVTSGPDAEASIKDKCRKLILYDVLYNGTRPEPRETVEKEFTDFEKDYPDDPVGAELVRRRVGLFSSSDAEYLEVTLRKLVQSPNKATAEAARRELDLRTEPLEFKFISIGGKAVDIAQMRGKVVLLHFWATWGEPARIILPKVLGLSKKYRGQGLRIIGISMDPHKRAMRKAIKTHGMDWPQCDDCREDGSSAIAARFDVSSPQKAWLVNRKGVAHDIPEGADLEEKVRSFLQEQP